ncbi:MAG: hypothetical protein D6719_07760 [Candidatus Dadabacteria bacterium]|nr:MAG: hypothetical protein D6719_07760 [Candidatus Dadabacteria bacterium]
MKNLKSSRGSSTVEYLLGVALVIMLVLSGVKNFGIQTKLVFDCAGGSISSLSDSEIAGGPPVPGQPKPKLFQCPKLNWEK